VIPGTATPVNPAIQPFIAAFRSPDAVLIPGVSATPGFEILQLQALETVDEKAAALRLDWQMNPHHKLYFRFFRDQGDDVAPEGISGRVVTIQAVPQNGVLGLQSVLKSDGSLINEFKIGYNGARTRINGSAPVVNGLDFSTLILNISGSVANTGIAGQGTSTGISIPGGLVRANSATNGRGQPYTPYSIGFIDGLNYLRGDHNFKFGGEVRLVRMYTDRLGGTTYTFSNLNAFLANTPASVQYLGDVSAPSPFNNGLTGERLAKQEYYIGYAQDEWKIKPNFTLSYGLRYEYYSPLRERNNGQVLFNIETGQIRPSNEAAYQSSKSNFGPRVAFTWSPNPSGRRIFRRQQDGDPRRFRHLLWPRARPRTRYNRSRATASVLLSQADRCLHFRQTFRGSSITSMRTRTIEVISRVRIRTFTRSRSGSTSTRFRGSSNFRMA
jgi:hypothetical protein